jgi:hypothetical protein
MSATAERDAQILWPNANSGINRAAQRARREAFANAGSGGVPVGGMTS